MPNKKGVIITVYKESTKLRSDQKTDPIKKINPIKKTNPNRLSSKPRVFEKRGYNRRAQLLAYAHELRHANAPQLQWPPFNKSRRKPNKWRSWSLRVQKKIRLMFSRFNVIKRKWKYEPIVTEDYSDVEEKMKDRNSHCCKKLRCFLKEICRGWQCKNGGC